MTPNDLKIKPLSVKERPYGWLATTAGNFYQYDSAKNQLLITERLTKDDGWKELSPDEAIRVMQEHHEAWVRSLFEKYCETDHMSKMTIVEKLDKLKKKQARPPMETDIAPDVEEMCVLGAMMISHAAMLRGVNLLTPEVFHGPKNALVFKAMVSLAKRNKAVDVLTVHEELTRQKKIEDVGMGYLASVHASTPTASNIEQHCLILCDPARKKKEDL